MTNFLTANSLKIIGKNKSISPITGSIITNGGIGCYNIFCESNIVASNITSTGDINIQENLNINGSIKVKDSIYPINNIGKLGLDKLRWDEIFGKNLDITGIISLGNKHNIESEIFEKSNDNLSDNINKNNSINDSPLLEITDKITINSDIELLNNFKDFVKINNNNIKVNGNIFVNNIFRLIGNNKLEIKGNISTENLIINNFCCIKPEYVTIDKEEYVLDIQSSIMILNIRMNTTLNFELQANIDNILVKLIFINHGNYKVKIFTENKDIETNIGVELFIVKQFITDDFRLTYYLI